MEDRKLSPECAEEVIELLDIVDSAELAEQHGESANLTHEEVASDTTTDAVLELGEEDIVSVDEALDLTDVVESSDSEILELTEVADSSESSVGEPYRAEVEADAQLMPEASVAEEKGEEGVTAMDASSEESSLQQTPPVSEAADEGIAADIEAVLALTAELDERIGYQEKTQDTRFQALEEQLAASERRCAELEGRVEELQHQLAECSSMFLGDAGVRLTLEEMVSRMIEARIPATPDEACVEPVEVIETPAVEEEMPESPLGEDVTPFVSEEAGICVAEDAVEAVDVTPSVSTDEELEADTSEAYVADQISVEESAPVESGEDTPSQQIIIDTIEEMAQHLIELEERVNGWEVRCEQEAALAAARVIREEIAALRAGAARMGR